MKIKRKCLVKTCNSRHGQQGISFHTMTKDPVRKKKWIELLDLGDISHLKQPVVCSNHFRKEDFITGGIITKLKSYSSPIVSKLLLVHFC